MRREGLNKTEIREQYGLTERMMRELPEPIHQRQAYIQGNGLVTVRYWLPKQVEPIASAHADEIEKLRRRREKKCEAANRSSVE